MKTFLIVYILYCVTILTFDKLLIVKTEDEYSFIKTIIKIPVLPVYIIFFCIQIMLMQKQYKRNKKKFVETPDKNPTENPVDLEHITEPIPFKSKRY